MPHASDLPSAEPRRAPRALRVAGVVCALGLGVVGVLAESAPVRAVAVGVAIVVAVRQGTVLAGDGHASAAAERVADLDLLLGVADLAEGASESELVSVAAAGLARRLGAEHGRGLCLPAEEPLDEATARLAAQVEQTGRPVHEGRQLGLPVLVDEQPAALLVISCDEGEESRALRLAERVAQQLGRRLQRRRDRDEIAAARDMAEAANSGQSAFLATMSHEMRTPLNGVLGMASILRGTELDESQTECVATLETSARGLLTQINDMLDYVRLGSDDVQLEEAPYDPAAALEEVVTDHAQAAHHKGLEIIVDVAPDLPARVLGDDVRVRQVLDQLVRNAIMYTARGVVMARLTSWQGGDGPVLRFEVADTGCGLAPESKATLFESFRQGDGSFARTHGGMGLGLALARRVALLLGGSLGVESVQERGSTFWLDVPGAVAEADPRPAASVSGLSVLVVDDHPQALRVSCTRLAEGGARAEGVADGAAALQRLRALASAGTPMDVVVIDHELEGESGAELGLAIRTDARLARTALLLSETSRQRADDALCAQVGFVERLRRPLWGSRLRAAVADAAAPREQTGAPPLPGPHPAAEAPTRAADRPTSGPLPADAHPAEPSKPSASARILVAEDNPVNQAVARRLLQRLGYRVDVAKNGKLAAEAASQVGYDLVLMDCQMPEMDGFEATVAIRKLPGRAGRLPIVALTANALIGDRQKCLDAGMDDYLSKPIDAEELGRVVGEWLERGTSPRAGAGPDGKPIPG